MTAPDNLLADWTDKKPKAVTARARRASWACEALPALSAPVRRDAIDSEPSHRGAPEPCADPEALPIDPDLHQVKMNRLAQWLDSISADAFECLAPPEDSPPAAPPRMSAEQLEGAGTNGARFADGEESAAAMRATLPRAPCIASGNAGRARRSSAPVAGDGVDFFPDLMPLSREEATARRASQHADDAVHRAGAATSNNQHVHQLSSSSCFLYLFAFHYVQKMNGSGLEAREGVISSGFCGVLFQRRQHCLLLATLHCTVATPNPGL